MAMMEAALVFFSKKVPTNIETTLRPNVRAHQLFSEVDVATVFPL